MKITKRIISAIMIIALLLASLSSCYFISGQKMRTVQGTYKLTNYTYTPSHQRREGYTPTTYDYINGENYMYEDYLIVTGTSTGYYVHKEVGGDNYIKEVTLRYEYDQEDSSKVNYVIYNDSISKNEDLGKYRLGVTKNHFNYSKSAFDYTEIITKRPMRTEALSVSWEKVSRATDLSYVEEQLGNLKEYDYQSFAKRGIYELTPSEIPEGSTAPVYRYLYVVMDTAKDSYTATVYYCVSGSEEQKTKTLTLSRVTDDWRSLTLDGIAWSTEAMTNNTYITEYDGITYTAIQVGYGIGAREINNLIATKTDTQY